MGAVSFYGVNFPLGTYAWTMRYYDPAAGQWLNGGNWLPAVTVDQPISVSNVGLNGAWVYTFCQGSTEGGPAFGPFGPYDMVDGRYEIDVRTGQLTPITEIPPFTKCVLVSAPSFPSQASPGDIVSIVCTIRNDGNNWGFCTVLDNLDVSTSRDNQYHGLNPGQIGTITISFTMPASAVTFHLWAVHWNFDTGVWANDSGEIGPFVIQATGIEAQVTDIGLAYARV